MSQNYKKQFLPRLPTRAIGSADLRKLSSCGASSLRSAEANRMRAMEEQMAAIATQMSTLVAALGKAQCTNVRAATSLPALGAQGAG